MSGTAFIGVLFELVSTMSGTVGKQLIRYSEKCKEGGNKGRSNTCFYSGIVINTLVGPIIDMIAYGLAPASLLAPFGGLDIVWNMLSAPFTLGEKLTKRRICSIILIFTGTIGSIFPMDHPDKKWDKELLRKVFIQPRVLIYIFGFTVWITFCLLVLVPMPKGSITRGFALGATAGTIAGNMFCVKATAELIKTSIEDKNMEVWADWLPYCVIFAAILFAVSNVVFMTKGLQEYQALFMVTCYEGSMVVSNAVSSLVILGELDDKPAWRVIWYVCCIGTIVLALVILITGETIAKEEEDGLLEHGVSAASLEMGAEPTSSDGKRFSEGGGHRPPTDTEETYKITTSGRDVQMNRVSIVDGPSS